MDAIIAAEPAIEAVLGFLAGPGGDLARRWCRHLRRTVDWLWPDDDRERILGDPPDVVIWTDDRGGPTGMQVWMSSAKAHRWYPLVDIFVNRTRRWWHCGRRGCEAAVLTRAASLWWRNGLHTTWLRRGAPPPALPGDEETYREIAEEQRVKRFLRAEAKKFAV